MEKEKKEREKRSWRGSGQRAHVMRMMMQWNRNERQISADAAAGG